MSHTRFVDNGTTMDRRIHSKKQITMESYTHYQYHYNLHYKSNTIPNLNSLYIPPLLPSIIVSLSLSYPIFPFREFRI